VGSNIGLTTASSGPRTPPGRPRRRRGALVAGLTAQGAPAGPAIAGVLVFRLPTFWLPIAPGWFAFRRLRRSGAI